MADHCKAVVAQLWQESLPDFAEMPVILWENTNCTGARWPPVGEHSQFDEVIELAHTHLGAIRSFYVPPHATLELQANRHALAHYGGISSDTSALLDQQWRSLDGGPCVSDVNGDCGRRIDWTVIPQWRVIRRKTWRQYMHDKAVHGSLDGTYSLKVNGQVYQPDFDGFMASVCDSDSGFLENNIDCACVAEFQQLQVDHPKVPVDQLKVGLLNSSCQPTKQYVPSTASRGTGERQQCQDMLYALIQAGSLTQTTGTIRCGVYSFDVSALPAVTTNKTADATTASTAALNLAWLCWVLVGFLVLAMTAVLVWHWRVQVKGKTVYHYGNN